MLHMCLMDELRIALQLMKYILNHPYQFCDWWPPFLTCIFKANAVLLTELICITVVCISIAPMEVVYNFIALGIIADFDNYIFESFIEELKCLLEEKEGTEN